MPNVKPEHMTSLQGNVLVPKTHDRIIFRGALDTLQAEILEAQILAVKVVEEYYYDALGEILVILRNVMKAEVTGTALGSFTLFGLSPDEIHEQSHNIKETFGIARFILPDHRMGALAIRLNYLRARVREVEILAVKAFEPETKLPESSFGQDIITAMNRISSALWWLFCRLVANADKSGATVEH